MAEVEPDAEIAAMNVLVKALDPLDDDARARVLDYTLKRLGMREVVSSSSLATPTLSEVIEQLPVAFAPAAAVVDIRTLREQKAPSSANEMAAVVAYYLAETAPADQRTETVTTPDIERLFKQAGYPLPSRIGNTLPNAAAAGYFDSTGRGEYKLNPVGFNLVTQNLPRTSGQAQRRSPTRKRTAAPPVRAAGARTAKAKAGSRAAKTPPKKKRTR
jgi:hypothetical protein